MWNITSNLFVGSNTYSSFLPLAFWGDCCYFENILCGWSEGVYDDRGVICSCLAFFLETYINVFIRLPFYHTRIRYLRWREQVSVLYWFVWNNQSAMYACRGMLTRVVSVPDLGITVYIGIVFFHFSLVTHRHKYNATMWCMGKVFSHSALQA